MSISKSWILAILVGAVVAGSACTQRADNETTLDATRDGAATAIDETKKAGEETANDTKNIAQKIGDKTKELAETTADKTTEIAGGVVDRSKDVVSATGEAITDGWITTRISAKFVDESLLKGSNVNVDTNNHVVTLKGTVASDAAKARAAAIARDNEGVTRVVNQIVVQ